MIENHMVLYTDEEFNRYWGDEDEPLISDWEEPYDILIFAELSSDA